MAFALHSVVVGNGSAPLARTDRVTLHHLPQQAYAAGASAGANSTFTVSGLILPATYSVLIGDLGQAGDCFISNRTVSGFTVNVAPPASTVTLAAGHVDLEIVS